ncbi:PAS domain S-box protein [Flavobacterium sp.]|uniref:PAS domain S-box protein n=1 Tax=Flavobacterium sp. TaxID=239 RepID=UPI00403485B4
MTIFIHITYLIFISFTAGWYIMKYKRKKRKADLTINRINDAVISIDRKGRYTFLNDAALATHPLGREKTLGKVIWDVHPEAVGTPFWEAYYKAMKTGEMVEFDSHYASISQWFSVKIYPSDTGLTIFYQNITQSKAIGKELSKSEEKYRALFHKSPLPAWLYDFESLGFIEVNDAAVDHYGYTREEFLAMTIKDIRPEEEIAALLEDIARVKIHPGSSHGSWRHRKKDGDIIIVEATAHSFAHDGRPVRLVIVNDITQKTIMEQKLMENQARLKEAQAIGRMGYWDVDLTTGTHSWSDELYSIFGTEVPETGPSKALFLSFIHPEDQVVAEAIISQALNSYTESGIDFRFYTSLGKKRYGSIQWRFYRNSDNIPIRLFGTLQDITERKVAEENSKLLESKIKEQKVQAQKKISKAIIKTQEKHKNYIGQELHDNINQILFGVRFHLGIAARNCDEVKELVSIPLEGVSKAMREIQLLSHNLVAPLSDADLQDIINEMIHKLNVDTETPLNINFSYDIPFDIPDDLKLTIYRIVQEHLHNIRKHAWASNVSIILEAKDKWAYISVEDDGKGFDVKQKRKGLGISNILHRVEAFNGKISMQSKIGEGSKTEITLPLVSNG